MQLPDDSVGISDLLAHRECPRRMSYGMRRHVGIGMQSDDRTPEAQSYATHYGSAIHHVIQEVEDGTPDEAAIQSAWNLYGALLEPTDLDLLREDLAVYRSRDFPGTRVIASEDDFRIPLFTHDGRQIYFRFKLDRLYERLDQPGTFIGVDYKSSRHAKSREEVDSDLQMWAYNFAIHEYWPECDTLLQVYDQLRYGQEPTRKSPKQRSQMRDWLVKQATSVLTDDRVQADGLLPPRRNRWCAWCPVMESCNVIAELTDFALTEIAALHPRRPKLKKDGTPGKRTEQVPLDPEKIDVYAEKLRTVLHAKGILKRFEESVKEILKELPTERRRDLEFALQERKNSVWTEDAKRELHGQLGPRFYDLVNLTKTGLEEELADDPDLLAWALGLAQEVKGAPSVVDARPA